MFKFLAFYLAVSIAVASSYRVTETDEVQGLFNIQNLIDNPGGEKVASTWSASGGTFATTQITSTIGRGVKAFTWDPTAVNQVVSTTAVAIPRALYGAKGIVSCPVFSPNSSTYILQAINESGTQIASSVITANSTYKRFTSEFSIPTSGSLAVQIKALGNNEPPIFWDDCFLGESQFSFDKNVNQRKTMTMSAKLAAPSAGACVVSAELTNLEVDDWIYGNATSGGTGICSITFNANMCSSAPTCLCTDADGSGRMCVVNTATTTGVTTSVITHDGTTSNAPVTLMCHCRQP